MSEEKKKLWGGRFRTSAADITERLSSSIKFDSRLYKQDIRGSIAHAEMLEKMGILSNDEFNKIKEGLKDIEKDIDEGNFEFLDSLEDIHMNIESRLTENIGDAGRKLHTGRSRNDQIALDMRLYLTDEIQIIKSLLNEFLLILISTAKDNIDTLVPGYTHLQVAQPVRFSHHILAYAWKILRDRKRLNHVEEACSYLPLGVGALSGVNYKNDREFLKQSLGFKHILYNSMDAVSDRDFILDFLYFASTLGTHLSRFCEEIILWSTSEFSYIKLADNVTTGSSIMPQKRNPDLAELIRGKTGRLYGNMISLFTILKGLPMTYNRDMQEDKEPLFDSVDTVKVSLEGMIEMIATMKVNKDRMEEGVYSNFSTATDIADYLAVKGVPFRTSHEVVGNIVKYCEDNNKDFFKLTFEDLKQFSSVFEADIILFLDPKESTERKKSIGSSATDEIKRQIEILEKEV
jgi:argininosuccinate lyase